MLNVKGQTFFMRKNGVIRELGEEKWNTFMSELAQKVPYFKRTIVATTSIPADEFIKLNEALLERFYNNDPSHYWQLGEKSAEYSFRDGPYKFLLATGDFEKYRQMGPLIWSTLFTEGELSASRQGDTFDVHITGVSMHHVYFELAALGFFKQGLLMTGAKEVVTQKVKGFSLGDSEIHYRFTIKTK